MEDRPIDRGNLEPLIKILSGDQRVKAEKLLNANKATMAQILEIPGESFEITGVHPLQADNHGGLPPLKVEILERSGGVKHLVAKFRDAKKDMAVMNGMRTLNVKYYDGIPVGLSSYLDGKGSATKIRPYDMDDDNCCAFDTEPVLSGKLSTYKQLQMNDGDGLISEFIEGVSFGGTEDFTGPRGESIFFSGSNVKDVTLAFLKLKAEKQGLRLVFNMPAIKASIAAHEIYAQAIGLKDLHLQNIIFQSDRIVLIDLEAFHLPGVYGATDLLPSRIILEGPVKEIRHIMTGTLHAIQENSRFIPISTQTLEENGYRWRSLLAGVKPEAWGDGEEGVEDHGEKKETYDPELDRLLAEEPETWIKHLKNGLTQHVGNTYSFRLDELSAKNYLAESFSASVVPIFVYDKMCIWGGEKKKHKIAELIRKVGTEKS